MKNLFFLLILVALIYSGCTNSIGNPSNEAIADNNEGKKSGSCADLCKAKKETAELSCKMVSAEIQERKETVLASLKKQMLAIVPMSNGYAFKFNGSDEMIDELAEFIKTERQCCDFFTYNLSVAGDKSEVWLELTGVEGSKEFIINEMGS